MAPPKLIQGKDIMTEAEVQSTVIERLRSLGALVFHPKRSDQSEPGFPDIEAVLPNKILWVETKSETGKLRKGRFAPKSGRWLPGQQEWIDAINRVHPGSAWVVKPSNLDAFLGMLKGE